MMRFYKWIGTVRRTVTVRWTNTRQIFICLLLFVCLIVGCRRTGNIRTGEPADSGPTDGASPTASWTPTWESGGLPADAPSSVTPEPSAVPDVLSEPLAALQGPDGSLPGWTSADIDTFLEASYHFLLLRDPELITELGLAVELGTGHDQLTNILDAYIRETQALEAAILDLLKSYDRSTLTPEQRLSVDIYAWYLEDRVQGSAFMYNDYPVSPAIFGFPGDLLHFFTQIHPVTNAQDAEDYIVRLSQVDTKVAQLLDGLQRREEAGVVLPRFILGWVLRDVQALAYNQARGTQLYTAFEEKLEALENIEEADKRALLEAAEAEIEASVIPAFKALSDYLMQQQSRATDEAGVWKFPNGEDYYAYALRHHTTTDITADEIHALGLQDVARIREEIHTLLDAKPAVCADLPRDAALPEVFRCVAEEGGTYDGEEILAGYEALIAAAKQDMMVAFDVRPQADVVVIGGATGAYYVPPAMDGSRPGAFYAPVSGSQPKFSMPTLAYHEAVPGHHVQLALAQELAGPAFRKHVVFTAYAEGWALYAERLAWELGFYEEDPYGDLGRLQAEAFRAARLVVDTGIHAKGWTYDEAVDYMVENTGLSRGLVEFEVARYIVWPGQATAYKIGMLKLLELRKLAVEELGEDFDLKAFHNVLLSQGSVPLGLLEQVVHDYIDASSSETGDATPVDREEEDVRITIVYDNYAYASDMKSAWGFSALVETGDQVLLFDTGGDAPTLLGNMERLDIDPARIQTVVLSHIHGDHVGGLAGLLATGVRPTVYVPPSFPLSFKKQVSATTELIEVVPGQEIAEGFSTTGELASGQLYEQALIIPIVLPTAEQVGDAPAMQPSGEQPGADSIIIVTGCSHPGIVNIVEQAKARVDVPVHLVVGGFHLGGKSRHQIQSIISSFRDLDVMQVAPTHCTGDQAISMFAEAYGDAYIQGGTGRVIVVEGHLADIHP